MSNLKKYFFKIIITKYKVICMVAIYLLFFFWTVKANLSLLQGWNILEVIFPSTARIVKYTVIDSVEANFNFDPTLEWTYLDRIRFKFIKIIFFNMDLMDMFILNVQETYKKETGMNLEIKVFSNMIEFQLFVNEYVDKGYFETSDFIIEDICLCYRAVPGKKIMVFQIIIFEGYLALVQDLDFEFTYTRNYGEVYELVSQNDDINFYEHQYAIARLSDAEIKQMEKELNDEAIPF